MDPDEQRRRPVQTSNYSQAGVQQHQSGSGAHNLAQRPETMQATTQSSQFQAAPSGGYGYGYYHEVGRSNEQALQHGLSSEPIEYDRNVPRTPQPQYYQQNVQNMVYGISQPQAYQYASGWYGPVAPSQPRPFRGPVPSELGLAPQPYFPAVSAPAMPLPNSTTTSPHPTQYYNQSSQQQITNTYEAYQQPNTGLVEDLNQRNDMETSHATRSPRTQRSEAFAKYNGLLRQTLEFAKVDRLDEAAQGMRAMAVELLGNVQRLGPSSAGLECQTQLLTHPAGLVFDDVAQRDFRLALWNNFNNTWLAVLNRQKEVSQVELSSGEKLEPPMNRISRATLQAIGNQLMELCNDVDEWGLVDYEMGVWEEQIMDLLEPCLGIALELDGSGSTSGRSKPPKDAKQATQSSTTNKSPGGKQR